MTLVLSTTDLQNRRYPHTFSPVEVSIIYVTAGTSGPVSMDVSLKL